MLLVLTPLASLSLVEREHGRTIPLADIRNATSEVDVIESRSQPRPWKVVTVPRGYDEDPAAARDRHYAAHPEDRDADAVIFEFYDAADET